MQRDSPMPVPSPTDFVVKNGSKMRWRMFGGTPGPLSEIAISAIPSFRSARVERRMTRRGATDIRACRALSMNWSAPDGSGRGRRRSWKLTVKSELDPNLGGAQLKGQKLDSGLDNAVQRDGKTLGLSLACHRQEGRTVARNAPRQSGCARRWPISTGSLSSPAAEPPARSRPTAGCSAHGQLRQAATPAWPSSRSERAPRADERPPPELSCAR